MQPEIANTLKLIVLCDAKQEEETRLEIIRNRGVRLWDDKLSEKELVHCEVIGNDAADQIECFIEQCPQATLVIDPLLQGLNPNFWNHAAGLRDNYADVKIYSPTTKFAFNNIISREMKYCGIDYRSRLAASIKSQYGSPLFGERILNEWVSQFSKLGLSSYGEDILRCVEVLSVGELGHLLSLDNITHYCVLSKNGSDHSIIRQLESFNNPHIIYSLREKLDHLNSGRITLLVDSVHSGSQLIEGLESCLNGISTLKGKIEVRVAHLTIFGVQRVNEWLKKKGLESIVSINPGKSLNINNILGTEARKSSELELRLKMLGYPEAYIEKVISFCRKIGAILKQHEDCSSFPDYAVGLGGFGLGLTSMIGFPGKGVLPILRLSGPVEFESRRLEWKGLFNHSNTSGAG